ncbi:MAG: hypothetical protein R3B96_12625 [Pirellulaceae bacterium]
MAPEVGLLQGLGEYAILVRNPSEVASDQVKVDVTLPAGLKITTLDRQARYDAETGRLSFTLERLEGPDSGWPAFGSTPRGGSAARIVVSATAREGLPSAGEHRLLINGLPDVTVQIADEGRPISVGDSARIRLTIRNQGTGPATGIIAPVDLPSNSSRPESPSEESDGNSNWFQVHAASG